MGLYLGDYKTLTLIDGGHWDKGVIILDDTLLPVENGINKSLLQTENLQAEELEIQTAIRKSLNNQEFVKVDFSNKSQDLTIICSPMPFACDEENLLGVLFIISNRLTKIPADLPTTLTIFNRIISNWVYRYNECITSRLDLIANPQ